MLKILVDGLRTEEDYLLYKRQGVFTSAMAFWESAVNDPQAKVKGLPLTSTHPHSPPTHPSTLTPYTPCI